MEKFSEILLAQIETIFVYLKGSLISTTFLIFIVVVLVLNIIRRIFICQERNRENINQSCVYLVVEANVQDCSFSTYRNYFKNNENGCDGCPGKTYSMSDEDIENRIIKSSLWKKIPVKLANYCKSALPYISFIYTLAIAIFEKSN